MESADKIKWDKEKDLSLNIRRMQPDEVGQGMRLSAAEGWNQTQNDWRLLVEDTRNICLLAEVDGKIIGTATAIDYANKEAWIGMVLVDKNHRGQGVSKALLADILEKLSSCPSIKLDATPAGQPVYQKFGFRDEYLVARMVHPGLSNLPVVDSDVAFEPFQSINTEELIALDRNVFGVERRQLIEYLTGNYPHRAWLLKRNSKVVGFVLGRDGNRFHHIGPLVAVTTSDAKLLLTKAMQTLKNQSIVVDVLDDKKDLVEWLNETGFTRQRHFIRMYKEKNPFPGEADKLYLICGPEFG